jgi:hypothetical protein
MNKNQHIMYANIHSAVQSLNMHSAVESLAWMSVTQIYESQNMDTLGFEPRAFRMRSGCDTTTPCAQWKSALMDRIFRTLCRTASELTRNTT